MARDDVNRREVYRPHFSAHIEAETVDEICKATNGNFALGSERFQKQIEEVLGRRAQRGRLGRQRGWQRLHRALV